MSASFYTGITMKYLLAVLLSLSSSVAVSHVEHHEANIKHKSDKPTQSELVSEIKQLISKAKANRDEKTYKQVLSKINIEEVLNPILFLYMADAQQYFHQFDEALYTLELATELPGAGLMKANILMTQGRFNEATKTCRQLVGKIDELLAITCYSHAISLNGQLEKGYNALSTFVKSKEDKRKKDLQWSYAVLGEMSERLSMLKHAEDYYSKALTINANDVSSRMALSDILIDQKRFDDVVKLTEKNLRYDPVLLRYVRALNIQGDKRMNGYFCELKRRVLSYKNKKEHLHYDTKSEYQLYFTDDIEAAMKDIQQHWNQQKLPRDARLISKVGVLKGAFDVLDEVRQWQLANKLEDQALTQILN